MGAEVNSYLYCYMSGIFHKGENPGCILKFPGLRLSLLRNQSVVPVTESR